ncbi:MAG: DUF4432 family protein [Gaiellaceae bacterium]
MIETLTLEHVDLSVDVLPTRGLDLGAARLGGERFSWESQLGHVPWRGEFFDSFGGGLMFTCGLGNVGVPSEGQPQHGWYTSLTAHDVEVESTAIRGRVVDAALELTREIAVIDGAVRVTDVVRNTGGAPEPAPLLYHVNLLWDTVTTDAGEVVPRDDDARAGDWRELGPPGPERVYEHIGASRATVGFGNIRVRVRSSLPRLWQWIDPSLGVLGIEPANCSVLGRAHDRAEGRLPVLAPGETRTSTLEITVEAA